MKLAGLVKSVVVVGGAKGEKLTWMDYKRRPGHVNKYTRTSNKETTNPSKGWLVEKDTYFKNITCNVHKHLWV